MSTYIVYKKSIYYNITQYYIDVTDATIEIVTRYILHVSSARISAQLLLLLLSAFNSFRSSKHFFLTLFLIESTYHARLRIAISDKLHL